MALRVYYRNLVVSGVLKWTASGSGTAEYYLEADAGGDPNVFNSEPPAIYENGSAMTPGTVGSLSAGEWDWGDNDTLGFSTVYVRLTDGADPDSKATGYVAARGDDTDGSTWAKAYQSIADADLLGAAAGTEIWLADDHKQSLPNGVTWDYAKGTWANPVKIISVDRSDDSYSIAASAQLGDGTAGTDFQVSGNVNWYGVYIDAPANVSINAATGPEREILEDCTVKFTDFCHLGGQYAATELRNCTIDAQTSSVYLGIGTRGATVTCRGCTISASTSGFELTVGTTGGLYFFEDCDISTINYLATSAGQHTTVILNRCVLKSGWKIVPSGAIGVAQRVKLWNCGVGAITVPPIGIYQDHQYTGIVSGSDSRYRTGGASDGETPYSWSMVTNANALEQFVPLESHPITRWVAGGSEITITVYVASGVTLQDDEFWIELHGPDNTANPSQTCLGYYASSRCAIRGTPANLTTDSGSTWNGSGVTTKQQVSLTYTPTEAGPISVVCFLAKPSTTVYVDPKIEVT